MIRQLITRKKVLLDLNTQKDFFLADGKACVGNHRRILSRIRRIMAWARLNNIPIVSTSQVFPDDHHSEHPYCCIDGTEGQRKISYTKVFRRKNFPADGSTDLPSDILHKFQQVVLHNRTLDPFDEPRIERLLTELDADEFVVMGATAEDTVKACVLGLLQRGKKVSVVRDAVGAVDKQESEMAIRKMMAKGARFVDSRKLAGKSRLNSAGACDCVMCSRMKTIHN